MFWETCGDSSLILWSCITFNVLWWRYNLQGWIVYGFSWLFILRTWSIVRFVDTSSRFTRIWAAVFGTLPLRTLLSAIASHDCSKFGSTSFESWPSATVFSFARPTTPPSLISTHSHFIVWAFRHPATPSWSVFLIESLPTFWPFPGSTSSSA